VRLRGYIAAVIVDCAHYVSGRRGDTEPLTVDEAADRLHGDGFVWLGLKEPSDEEMEEVAHRFDLPPLAVEDAREMHQRPKIEDYGDDWFMVVKAARYDEARELVQFGEVQIFAGEHYAVVVRHGDIEDLRGVRRRLEDTPALMHEGPAAVAWAVLDKIVDDYEPVIDGIESDIEEVERSIFEDDTDQTQRIYFLRRELARFYRATHPLLTAMQAIWREDQVPRVSTDLRNYFRDVADHLTRLNEEIGMQRDLLDGALNANLGAINVRQNDIVRKVSGWAAIGIVPTLIASIYGMNFEHMPELRWHLGYPGVLVLMVVLSFTLWRFLRRWGWL
jgi:magnesium transporter